MSGEVSHGRGGAGNINHDDTQYVDGEVVRAGIEGSHGDGAYSTGRGGAANIGDAGTHAPARLDKDLVPTEATRPSTENADFHTGRGGAGNAEHHGLGEHHGHAHASNTKTAEDGVTQPLGLADKLKSKLLGVFKK